MDDKDILVKYLIPIILKENGGILPSIICTEYYLKDVLDDLISNSMIIWSNSSLINNSRILNEGILKINSSQSMIFFQKRQDENIYKFYILSDEDKMDSMLFHFNKYKKLKTIS